MDTEKAIKKTRQLIALASFVSEAVIYGDRGMKNETAVLAQMVIDAGEDLEKFIDA